MPKRIAATLAALMVLGGVSLIVWSWAQLPRPEGPSLAAGDASPRRIDTAGAAQSGPPAALTVTATQTVTSTVPRPQVVGLDPALPRGLVAAVNRLAISDTEVLTAAAGAISVTLNLEVGSDQGLVVYREVYAPAARFDTIDPSISAAEVQALWRGVTTDTLPFGQVAVLSATLPSLVALLGEAGPTVQGHGGEDELIDAVWAADGAGLALLPFDRLRPELAALAVDGQIPVENEYAFDIETYPLVLTVRARGDNGVGDLLDRIERESGGTNRDPSRLTVVAMTGVTAMVRLTADQMDKRGAAWPAEVVGPELAAADITHISNEVPFVPDCVTNTSAANLTFCSKPEYMATLEAVGADIIGLTGNHQNDYGWDDALVSLDIYAEANLPVYGGGRNKEDAFAPLYMEHNGNRLAFLGANSYGPPFAWARDNAPGSAEFDINILSATIRSIVEKEKAEVVLVELQYQESYHVQPLWDQRQNFRLLSQAGADIVTGVQSHVPQAVEFDDGRLILYGLGNLFFDQMWEQATREGMVVKHTIYAGRHISTRILTTLLHDYGQPRWATGEERERILRRVFDASYWERPRP